MQLRLRVGLLLFWLGLVCVEAPLVKAADFCALKVRASLQNEIPLDGTKMRLRSPDGSVAAETVFQNGIAEICDFGDATYSLVIGSEQCNRITIEGIRFIYGSPNEFDISMSICPYGEGAGFSTACFFLVRVKDGINGAPLQANIVDLETKRSETADKYGRATTAVRPGVTRRYTVKAPGYSDYVLQLQCSSDGYPPLGYKSVEVRLQPMQNK